MGSWSVILDPRRGTGESRSTAAYEDKVKDNSVEVRSALVQVGWRTRCMFPCCLL
jgi:hypothetical protein